MQGEFIGKLFDKWYDWNFQQYCWFVVKNSSVSLQLIELQTFQIDALKGEVLWGNLIVKYSFKASHPFLENLFNRIFPFSQVINSNIFELALIESHQKKSVSMTFWLVY